jgi:hypothetical protein
MARKVTQADPVLAIEFFLSGFYTHRSQLFAPFKGIGVNVVAFHDPVIDGENMEDTDLYEWQRRPGFSIFCPIALADDEIINQFYWMRNLNGQVISFMDSTQRLTSFTSDDLISIITKTTGDQGFITPVQNMVYFSDGASADMQKWQSVEPFTSINPSTWGIPAPTLTPTIFSNGCWLPFTSFVVNNAILDPNGNVEVVTKVYGGSGSTGGTQPLWPTTIAATINDGSIQWTNMGPLLSWLPAQFYPVPVVILDTNGNLELATATTPTVAQWDSGTSYTVGTVVLFAGLYWAALVDNTDIPPSENYVQTTTSGSTSITQPYWVQTQSPSTTGTYPTAPFTPTWNQEVGGQTTDGNYIWTNLGPGVLVESYGTAYVYCYRTIYGHLSTASPASLNTGSIFGPQVSTITSFQISANVVTFQGANNFIPGSVFSVEGLTFGTYLNNQTFIVQATGLSPTQFSASFTFPDVPSTTDSGATVNLIASVNGVGSTSVLCNATATITASAVLDGVVTLYAVNDFVPGLFVTLTGLTVATFLNNLQFQIINVDPNGQWFQVYFTTDLGVVPANQNQTTDTGTATFNAVEVYRLSDGGGIYLFAGAVTNPPVSQAPSQSYDSGLLLAGHGADNGMPGTYVWDNPNNVTSTVDYATVSVPAPTMTGTGRFAPVQTCQFYENRQAAGIPPNGSIQTHFGAPCTAGNSILVFVNVHNDGQTGGPAISDSQGNSYALIASQENQFPDGSHVLNQIYLANLISAGATTMIMTYGGNAPANSWFGMSATECSGLAGTAETPATAVQNTGLNLNPGSITTAQPTEVVISFAWNEVGTNASQAMSFPGAFSLFSSQVFQEPTGSGSHFKGQYLQMAAVWQAQTATGTFDPQWQTPSDLYSMGITVSLPLYIYNLSDGLDATNFDFTVPTGIQITGITVEFNASFDGTAGDGILDVQLLQNGTPVGSVMNVPLQVSAGAAYVLGSANTRWGFRWQPSDVNNSSWGVRFIATQKVGGTTATFGVSDVNVQINGGTSTGWFFDDFTSDQDLNVLLIAPQNHQNDPPPGAVGSTINQTIGTLTAYWNGRIWMAVGNFVYFDAGPDCTNGVPEESWPPANRFQFAGPVLNLIPTPDGVGLLVYLADRVNAILGGPETISFYPTDALSNFGISSPNSVYKDRSVIGQFTTQKQYYDIEGSGMPETGEHIADYLTENFNPDTTYATLHRNGLDVGIFLSNGVDRVMRYGSNIGAWSAPAFPNFGAGALRSIETSVGIYSLMLGAPNGGVTSTTPFTNPGVGLSVGMSPALAWDTPSNITLGNEDDYATLTLGVSQTGQILQASNYPFNIPASAVIQGIQVSITGKQATPGGTPFTIIPLNAVSGAESHEFGLGSGGSIIDQQATENTQLTLPVSVGPLTPSSGTDFALYSVFLAGTSGAPTINSGWTTITASNNPYAFGSWYQVTTGAITGIANGSGGDPTYGSVGALSLFASNGSPAVVQEVSSQGPTTAMFSAPVTPGNAIIVIVSMYGFSGQQPFTVAPTDDGSDAFTLVSDPIAGTNPLVQIFTFICPVSVGGFHEVQFNASTSNAINSTIMEVSGLSGAVVNTTVAFGSTTDLWGMSSWMSPSIVNGSNFGFRISTDNSEDEFEISLVQVKVTYQNPGNYIYARDLNSWGDAGTYGANNGTPYDDCFVTIGSITLTQPGAVMMALQHVVGYFDAVGTGGEGGAPTPPNVWILPNEISDTAGVGFIQLPEAVPEPPPPAQNYPSRSLLALRWPLNMMNSDSASQFIHHLQVKIEFPAENAPNTIKAIAFKENQE